MKKQSKTYLLIFAVIIVWGGIAFQLFDYVQPQEDNFPITIPSVNKTTQKVNKKEVYKVRKHKRDPFLGSINTPQKNKVIKPFSEAINLPVIKYNGIIEGGNKKSFIVSINGKQEILKLHQKINNLTLVSANQKQIIISYKGKRKVITRD